MIQDVLYHELKNIFFSPKFTVTFLTVTALVALSVLAGISQFQKSTRQYETTTRLVRQEMREASSWMALNNRVLRKPDPMQIFVSGVNNDVGRISSVTTFEGIKLSHSTYSDDPIYAVFRFIDFAFIVTAVFSLLAVLFTYDAVNGEAERGTLHLVFSNSIPRAHFLLGKFFGAWLGLVIPLLIPLMLAVLFLFMFHIPMSANDWIKISILFGTSILFITFFISLGILLSTVTKHSNVSFLFSLVLWVTLIFIVPRIGSTVAGYMVPVPTVAEIESRLDTYSKDRWTRYENGMQEKWKQRNAPLQNLSKEEREKFREEKMWEWMEEDDRDRKQVQKDIDDYSLTENESIRNRKAEQERLAFALSRFSPASSYQFASMALAGTDIGLKSRFEDALTQYRPMFNSYKDKKQKENGGNGGIRIEVNSDSGFKIDTGREKGVLDLSDMPQFLQPENPLKNIAGSIMIDLGIISVFTLISFAGSYIRFLRYDVK